MAWMTAGRGGTVSRRYTRKTDTQCVWVTVGTPARRVDIFIWSSGATQLEAEIVIGGYGLHWLLQLQVRHGPGFRRPNSWTVVATGNDQRQQ